MEGRGRPPQNDAPTGSRRTDTEWTDTEPIGTERTDTGRRGTERFARTRARVDTVTREARARLGEHPRGREEPPDGSSLADEPPHPAGRSVPDGLKEAASWSWRLLLVGAVALIVVRMLAMVPIVTVPFVVALLFTAVLGPVKHWLHRRCRVPHSLAAFLALLVGVAVIVVLATFVGQQISTNAPRMAERFVQFIDQASSWLRYGPLQISDAQVEAYGQELTAAITRNQQALVTGALSTLSALSHVVAGALLLLLSIFFLLRDGDLIWGWVLSLLPRRSRARIDQVGRFGWHTLGGFVRGQTIIAALHASTIFVVLVLLDVPLAVALAVLIFVGSYIPILGMTVTGAFCVIVSLIEDGPGAAIVVAVTILILVQLEAHLLQPLIMARNVEVHPLGVAVAVLAGTALGGIAGALFAVPTVAFLNATIRAAHMPLPGPGERGQATAPAASAALEPPPVAPAGDPAPEVTPQAAAAQPR